MSKIITPEEAKRVVGAQTSLSNEREPARIAVCLVSHENVPFAFAAHFGSLMAYTAAVMPDEVVLEVNTISGTYVHIARQEMIMQMLAAGATHLLWIDTDMTFPQDALVRLMQHQKYVVGCNYAKRTLDPPGFVAIKKIGTDTTGGEVLRTGPESTGLEQVEGIGFGLLLMRAEIAAALPHPSEGPWFGHEWLPRRRNWIGEDVYFCNLLKKAGVPIYVDHDLSKEVGHVGQFTYRCQHVTDAEANGVKVEYHPGRNIEPVEEGAEA